MKRYKLGEICEIVSGSTPQTSIDEYWDGDFTSERPIDWDEYKNYSEAYEYAMDMTTKECYQAVEGMYHNLNCIRAA